MNQSNYINNSQLTNAVKLDSPSWILFTKASFGLALAGMIAGIVMMPVDLWIRGYLIMGSLFLCGSSFTMSKTLRDEFEANKLINRIEEAKAEKLLKGMAEDED